MKRILYNELLLWKEKNNRKPLLLQGARQVGKTYLINEFGKTAYKNYVYLNFEQEVEAKNMFNGSLNPKEIISNISLYLGKKIEANDTLIFFDEIQISPEAITSLKYFYEQAPEFHIIAAGSLLGVSVGKQSSFPVGKVNFKTLYPLSFKEYLMAKNEGLLLERLEIKKNFDEITTILHEKLIAHLRMFLFIGGMPEVVQNYLNENDIASVRTIQLEILEAYARDFSKYTDRNQAIKTSELWQTIPYQLARENKKFKYNEIRKNARSSAYQHTIEWLKMAGLIHVSQQITTPKLPLAAYSDNSKFKVFLLDTGLLGAMLNVTSKIIIKPNQLFIEYNGAFIENFVATELIKNTTSKLFYWTSKSDAEVDFIVQIENNIFPVEVKSGLSRNLKSIRSYAHKHRPSLICRISPRNFYTDNDFVNIPLYATFLFENLFTKN